MDDVPETITVITDMFSSYAIAYRETGRANTGNGGAACGLCHICPAFLGICCFVWLAVIIAANLIIIFVTQWQRKKGKPERQAG